MADALDLGSSPNGCRFKSCYPHQLKTKLNLDFSRFNFYCSSNCLSLFISLIENPSRLIAVKWAARWHLFFIFYHI